MTREIAKIANNQGEYKFHIIGFSNNSTYQPDEWEIEGIKKLKEGLNEIYTVIDINGTKYFRYMKQFNGNNAYLNDSKGHVDFKEVISLIIPTSVSDSVHVAKVKRSLISFSFIGIISILFIVLIISRFSKRISSGIDKEMEKNKLKAAIELAGATAHEMRQPLAVLIGFSELLKDKISKGKSPEEDLKIIINECYRIDDIISKMLNITHYKIKNYTDSIKIFDLHAQEKQSDSSLLEFSAKKSTENSNSS
jgi:hypothetical protein